MASSSEKHSKRRRRDLPVSCKSLLDSRLHMFALEHLEAGRCFSVSRCSAVEAEVAGAESLAQKPT